MIAYIEGTIIYLGNQSVIVLVNGLGYEVYISAGELSKIKIGEQIKLYCYNNIREDASDLYGFSKVGDLELFKLLIGVSGIGPKTALGVFSLGGADRIQSAIAAADVDFFTSVPRLGKKNAQKIIIDLKSKIGGLADLDLAGDSTAKDVISALETLGFNRRESNEAFRQVREPGMSVDILIKNTLRFLGRK